MVKQNASLVLPAFKIMGVPLASGTQSSSSRPAIQAGPNSPPYFPEFEDSPVYKFFRDRFTAPPNELAALKSQMPNDIARHMIDGFIGPGPFAQEPFQLGSIDGSDHELAIYNYLISYGFGCHRCGAIVPGTDSGSLILDHQMPEKLNFGNWHYRFYPHCWACARKQGGHVTVIRLRRGGWVP